MKSALYYLILVVIPLGGLMLILQAGSRIVPPRSIGGVWDVAPTESRGALDCGLTSEAGASEMRVAQSGVRASVSLSDRARTTFSVELRRDSVSGLVPPGATECSQARSLVAEVRTEGERETMVGELRAVGCSDCPATPLQASRRAGVVRE
jgi:hypothetical protein